MSAGREAGARVLLVGESWVTHSTHLKGFDAFQTTEYVEGAGAFLAALRETGHDVAYVRAHEVATAFPASAEALAAVADVVVLSDIGANSFLLTPETFNESRIAPNRLTALAEFVRAGGGLLMVGGYLSFSGIDGRARWGRSPIGSVLPVQVDDVDDRVETPEGLEAEVLLGEHPALAGVPTAWPPLLGYNRVEIGAGSTELVRIGTDPLLAVGRSGAGRVAAFTSDLAPHWAPPDFVAWDGYAPLWDGVVRWLTSGACA